MTRRTETVIFHGGATLAFTDYETEQLRKALLKETRHCAVTLGMKKTSVDQLTKAVLDVRRRLSDTGDMVFIENDAKLLLQRLPEGVKNVHYHDDETHIRLLLEKYDLVPSRGSSLAAATVRGLILTVSHQEQIGELYPQVLETLVYGACRELFK